MRAGRREAAHAFGHALRSARRAQGISQEDLAGICEFDRTYPGMLELDSGNPHSSSSCSLQMDWARTRSRCLATPWPGFVKGHEPGQP
jgi:transcriptional regulator with XRE-family HTH domain